MNEETKKELIKIVEDLLDRKFEEKFIPLFNQGFEEVVVPQLEILEEKMDKGFKQVNSKFDSINRRLDDHSIKSTDQDRRIKKLENTVIAR